MFRLRQCPEQAPSETGFFLKFRAYKNNVTRRGNRRLGVSTRDVSIDGKPCSGSAPAFRGRKRHARSPQEASGQPSAALMPLERAVPSRCADWTAALRGFDPAYVSSGSKTEIQRFGLMSASPSCGHKRRGALKPAGHYPDSRWHGCCEPSSGSGPQPPWALHPEQGTPFRKSHPISLPVRSRRSCICLSTCFDASMNSSTDMCRYCRGSCVSRRSPWGSRSWCGHQVKN